MTTECKCLLIDFLYMSIDVLNMISMLRSIAKIKKVYKI